MIPCPSKPWRLFGAWLATASLAATTSALFAQVPAFSTSASHALESISKGRYLDGDDELTAAAFDAAGKVKDRTAFQLWTQFHPFLTNELPVDIFLTNAEAPAQPEEEWARSFSNATPRDALSEIARRAAKTSIVILNESHNTPRHRAFALEVAEKLRPLGYTFLAIETLIGETSASGDSPLDRLPRDGVVRMGTGGYSKDPVFARFIGTAIRSGYTPVAYEQTKAQGVGKQDIASREEAQAENLLRAIPTIGKGAKILIYVGLSHAAEEPLPGSNGSVRWMAARLKAATGIDPLTIDQATVTDTSPLARSAYQVAAEKMGKTSSIFLRGNRPVVVGPYAGSVDLQVIHPKRTWRYDRPSWLVEMGGIPHKLSVTLMPDKGTRLIQVYRRDDPGDAVPFDQVLATRGDQAPTIMIPPGPVRYQIQTSTTCRPTSTRLDPTCKDMPEVDRSIF